MKTYELNSADRTEYAKWYTTSMLFHLRNKEIKPLLKKHGIKLDDHLLEHKINLVPGLRVQIDCLREIERLVLKRAEQLVTEKD